MSLTSEKWPIVQIILQSRSRGCFCFFYPLRWGPGRLAVGGKNTSKRVVIQMEWEICLPASKCCRWEEEMTMDLFPRWPARMLHRTEWRQTEGERREEAFCRLKSGWPWWRDVITVSAPSSSRSSLVGPFHDLLAAWQKKCSFSVWGFNFQV